MSSIATALSPSAALTLECAIAGRGVACVPADAFGPLKTKLQLPDQTPVPATLVKHSDEQTIAALAAVLTAVHQFHLNQTDFTHWGVLAAPHFLGRQALAHTLQRFAAEGAWGISPHVIPHRLLHAVSGTISLALRIHGPNFGVDGMPGDTAQLLATALAVLSTGQLPGVWAVLTGWAPEPIPARPGVPPAGPPAGQPVCRAVALALVPEGDNPGTPRLRYQPPSARDRTEESKPLFSLEALADALGNEPSVATGTSWRLRGGGRVEILGTHGC